ncbi:aminopeptidase N [Limoniibacter endophyticus]|uniref:Aminopeptidase N n=1 Tax=Limoniibacter endophyticus TaxID=1565040 RepID=A0A8J3DGI2_9HYPH|nr:aminopeptidase N [Limoniibacter endophyticus]GHC69218.1 aminopeptidase N [Limoniibacter endophyticus]
MRTETGTVFRLQDYRPSDFLIPETRLIFRLDPRETLVTATLSLERRDPAADVTALKLAGDGLVLKSISIDGKALAADAYEATADCLIIKQLPSSSSFSLTIETEIDPEENKALMGLYRSSGNYCTQCEAEGFRRITYFYDRPDVLSIYSVRIEADRANCPVLLSNGNPGASGDLGDGRHFAEWHDPHPKPSYLFALVAGDLGVIRDHFTTASGKPVDLAIYVEHGKEERALYAMDALKRSMKWDEDVFGCEYDLDVFNIVAVSDFNMGAMENKGLNVFNDKYVLADEKTATDVDYALIEAIIGHEYFHNWTGNRITCRDWFQLCLKEGLTVFRDHEFSADQRSRAVKRIAEVRTLRTHQFPEDQGPLSHPVRPDVYKEINNFYTTTIYEKGSEVVRMIRTLLGEQAFRAGMDLYLKRHDGDAATIEDFVKSFEDAAKLDLSQFSLWYHQNGTPKVTLSTAYDQTAGTFTLHLKQSAIGGPALNTRKPLLIPLVFGLLGRDGSELAYTAPQGVDGSVIRFDAMEKSFVFEGLKEKPILSINRGFSAPIVLKDDFDVAHRLFLAAHDSDAFNRWEAINALLMDALKNAVGQEKTGAALDFPPQILSLMGKIAENDSLEPAFRALALTPPSEADLAREIGENIDPDAIYAARIALQASIGKANAAAFEKIYAANAINGPFAPDAEQSGKRSLRNVLLDYLSLADGGPGRAHQSAMQSGNMTDRIAALSVLAHRFPDADETRTELSRFEHDFRSDPLVLDKWMQIQATIPGEQTVARVRALMNHPAFSMLNPNRVRALIGAFSSANQTAFHSADGSGYTLFAEVVTKADERNPQLAARLAIALRSWRSLEPVRREKARETLAVMAAREGCSIDLSDILERTLA